MAAFWLDILQWEPPQAGVERAFDAYGEKGKFDEAVARLNRLISRDPMNPGLHMALADLYGRSESFEFAGGYSYTFPGRPYAARYETWLANKLVWTPRERLNFLLMESARFDRASRLYYRHHRHMYEWCCLINCANPACPANCCDIAEGWRKQSLAFQRTSRAYCEEARKSAPAVDCSPPEQTARSSKAENPFDDAKFAARGAQKPLDEILFGRAVILHSGDEGARRKAENLKAVLRKRACYLYGSAFYFSMDIVSLDKEQLPPN